MQHKKVSQQTIGGGSTCINDDVINSMTSLLLLYSARKKGGQLTSLTPLRLPPYVALHDSITPDHSKVISATSEESFSFFDSPSSPSMTISQTGGVFFLAG